MLKKFLYRIQQILSGEGVSKVEFWNAIIAISFGLFLFLPMNTLNTLDVDDKFLIGIFSENLWGLLFTLIGISKFFFIYSGVFFGRKWTAFFLSFLWMSFAIDWIIYSPYAPTSIFAFVFAIMSAYVVLFVRKRKYE